MDEENIDALKKKVESQQKTINALIAFAEKLSLRQEHLILDTQTDNRIKSALAFHKREAKAAKSQQESTQAELDSERDFIRSTMQSVHEAVVVTNVLGEIFYINPAAEDLFNQKTTLIKSQKINAAFHIKSKDGDPLQLDLNEHSEPKLGFLYDAEDNFKCTIQWTTSIVQEKGTSAHQGYVFVFTDITDSHRLKSQLERQAIHDTLTGLINRFEFDRRLANCLAREHSPSTRHSLLYIDLDQFKVVNDTCGHKAGDHLLRQLSAILAPQFRERDTLARLGGDEFGVLLESCPKSAAKKLARNVLRLIQDFRFNWENKTFNIGASIGIAHFSSGADTQNDPLSMADLSCYKAKEEGRNRIHEVDLAEPNSNVSLPHSQMLWVSRINEAIEKDRFVLMHQIISPLKKTVDENRLHYEILVRLCDDDGELIMPGSFLPAAERYSLIHLVDHWVVKNTFKWLSEYPMILKKTKRCSINLSGQSLSDQTLTESIRFYLEAYDIECEKICFEITETSAIHNLALAKDFMTEMQKLGCRFALDDFGTGMSSFSYLKQLPVHYLKIDGSFIRDITTDPIDHAMTRSINEIGQVMQMKTIAEFVEDEASLELVKKIGVDYAQGFHIHKPAPLDTLLDRLD